MRTVRRAEMDLYVSTCRRELKGHLLITWIRISTNAYNMWIALRSAVASRHTYEVVRASTRSRVVAEPK